MVVTRCLTQICREFILHFNFNWLCVKIMPYALLALCARLNGSPTQHQQLRNVAKTISNWPNLVRQAERNGLGPLVYTHLKAAETPIPKDTFRELQALYLRHQHTNRVRSQILAQILDAYRQTNIEALVLKGAALAHISYPQPGLRPMRDIDLLVRESQMWQAQAVLEELGFNAPQRFPGQETHHHLAVASKQVEGFQVSVEVHHNLFLERIEQSMSFDELSADPLLFTLPTGVQAHTLGYEDMLWHICLHIAQISQSFRLIWVADVVGFAEKFVSKINWQRVKQDYPRVIQILALFHHIMPLSDTLQEQAGIKPGRPPNDIGKEFSGWPRYSVKMMRRSKSYPQIVRDTLFPPEWWLCLYHGVAPSQGLNKVRWVGHPLHISSFVVQLLRK